MQSQKTKQFFKDYKLPLKATGIFIVILLSIVFLRFYEQSSLANLLNNRNSKQSDYSKLLSNDKTASINKHDVTEAASTNISKSGTNSSINQPNTNTSTTPSSSSSTESNNNSTQSSGTSGSGTSGSGTSTTTESSGGTTTKPFSATATSNTLATNQTVNCGTSGSMSNTCYYSAKFRGTFQALNGPGRVEYMWYWGGGASGAGNNSGHYDVPSGSFSALTVYQDVSMTCLRGQSFVVNVYFKISSPAPESSKPYSSPVYCGP